MKIRRVLFEHDEPTGTRALIDIVEDDVPPADDIKKHAAMRRKLLRELDRQIGQMINGEIYEINLLLMRD